MYRSILVPLDGTPFGEQALPLAAAVARRTGALLRLVHVHVPESWWTALEVMPTLETASRELTVQREQGYLDGVVASLAGAGAAVEAELPDGPVARTVAERAQAADVDLVVLATHARTGMSRLWHRGVAAYLTRNLNVPVLMVHPPTATPVDAEPRVRRILLPLGGAAYSERVLEHAVELGELFRARYSLLKVVEPPVSIGYTLEGQDGHVNASALEDLREAALRYLETVADGLRRRGFDADAEVIDSADAGAAIIGYVERAAGDAPVDLVAMETHGLGAAAHLFTHSVVEEVVHGATVPVLVHHAAAAPEAAPDEEEEPHMGWPEHRHDAPVGEGA